jgi:chemotaxis protein MotB
MFPSNWELSTARATTVIRHLLNRYHFSPDKLSAAGYGEYKPVGDNAKPEGRKLNRRVDIVVLRTSTVQQEPE